MKGPKLIGTFSLPFPRARKVTPDLTEYIREIGIDEDGQAWGLVVRGFVVRRQPHLVSRLTAHRWVRFNAISFMPNEEVTEETWNVEDSPPALPGMDK